MAGKPSDLTIRIFELLMGASLDMETIFEKGCTGEYMRLQISPERYKALMAGRRQAKYSIQRMTDGMREKKRLNALLSVLNTQGLIRADGEKRKSLFSLTKKGIAKLKMWKMAKPSG